MDTQNQIVLRETTIALLWHIAQQHARVDTHDSRLLEDEYTSLCALRSRPEREDKPDNAALWCGLRELLISFGTGKLYCSMPSSVVASPVC